MSNTNADFIESLVEGIFQAAVQQIQDNWEGLGERMPFTERLSEKERYELWFNAQTRGVQGWTDFMMEQAQKYQDPNMLMKDVAEFCAWGNRQSEKSLVSVPSLMESGMEMA